jgi:hypothetical protein
MPGARRFSEHLDLTLAPTPKPADGGAVLLAYAPPFAFLTHALLSHTPSGPLYDGLSPQMARAGTTSDGRRMSSLSALSTLPAHADILHSDYRSSMPGAGAPVPDPLAAAAAALPLRIASKQWSMPYKNCNSNLVHFAEVCGAA